MSELPRSPSVLSVTSMVSDTMSISAFSASTTTTPPEMEDRVETGDATAPEVADAPAKRPSVLKSTRFYYRDGSLSLVAAEGTEYRVHGSLFEAHSTIWAERLRDSDGDDGAQFVGIKAKELDAFLSILYPSHFSDSKGPSMTSVEDWSSVLRLSTLWSFEDIRSLAIERLAILAPSLDKLVLSHEYDISQWRIPAYVDLCLRDTMLSRKEAARLTTDDIVDIASAREAVLKGQVPARRDALHAYLFKREHDEPEALQSEEVDHPALSQLSESLATQPDVAEQNEPAFSFTSDETSRLSDLCTSGNFADALSMVNSSGAAAFWALALCTSDISTSKPSLRKLTRAVMRRCALEPSFNKAASIILREAAASFEQRTAPQDISIETFRTVLYQDIRALLWAWSRAHDAAAQWVPKNHRSPPLGYVIPFYTALEGALNDCSKEVLGTPSEFLLNWEKFNQRSSNVKDLINALAREGIVEEAVLRL